MNKNWKDFIQSAITVGNIPCHPSCLTLTLMQISMPVLVIGDLDLEGISCSSMAVRMLNHPWVAESICKLESDWVWGTTCEELVPMKVEESCHLVFASNLRNAPSGGMIQSTINYQIHCNLPTILYLSLLWSKVQLARLYGHGFGRILARYHLRDIHVQISKSLNYWDGCEFIWIDTKNVGEHKRVYRSVDVDSDVADPTPTPQSGTPLRESLITSNTISTIWQFHHHSSHKWIK